MAEMIHLSNDQQDIVKFMTSRSTGICSAQTGLGKTIASLVTIHVLLSKFPTLHAVVCCPHKALKAYKKEAKRLGIPINVFSSEEKIVDQRRRIDIVTHTFYEKYVMSRRLANLHKNHRLMMYIDELHCYQNPNSKMYKVMMQTRPIFAIFQGQTATTIKSNPMGFYWMCYLVNMKVLGQNPDQFKAKYLLTKKVRIYRRGFYQMQDEVIGISNPVALQEAVKNFIIFRQKEYNIKYEFLKVDPTEEEKHLLKLAGNGKLSESDNRAAWLHDIQRVIDSSHPQYPINSVSSKEKLLFTTLKKCLEEGHTPIVYIEYYDTIDRIVGILERNKKWVGFSQILQVTGRVSQKQRRAVEDRIDKKTITIITAAGSESINLQGNQNCEGHDTIIFYDGTFSIKTILQAVGRITRVDTKHAEQLVKIIELKGSLDTYKRVLMQARIGMINSVFGKQNSMDIQTVNMDKDLQDLMRKAFLWAKDGYMNDDRIRELENNLGVNKDE